MEYSEKRIKRMAFVYRIDNQVSDREDSRVNEDHRMIYNK
jgi:hypothetical protein